MKRLRLVFAILILTISITGPMTIASQALSGARYAKEQVAAYYLAQEGIELVRSVRDNNVLNFPSTVWYGGELGTATSSPTRCYTSQGCYIDAQNLVVSECPLSGSCPPLRVNAGFYQYSAGGNSQFTRTINLAPVGSGGNEIYVSSTVTWLSPLFGTSRTYTVTDNLTSWSQ